MAFQPQSGLEMLGPEEAAHHTALIQLAAEVQRAISSLADATQSKASQSLLDRQVQHKLAQLRAHIRDLELLAEEQDT